jgi:peptide chain release factor 1
MFEQLGELETELDRLEGELPTIYASGDRRASRDAGRRHAALKPIVDAYREWRKASGDLSDARELLAHESDAEMREYLQGEIAEKEERLDALEHEIKELLLPRDPNEGRNVIIDHGGFRDVTFLVKGDDAWRLLKYEGGPHRVQRVPATESQGRVHTSAATVAILPEAEEVDVDIDPNDLDIDVFRATGPGGQSVNTTDSAVRITHKPTGLVVSCQDEKSQLQNKDKALRILRSRLLQIEQERQQAEVSAARREQVKGGGRSEKIRTYNFKENRVTDHRVGITLYSLDRVLDGELDDVVSELAADERRRQLGAN